MFERHSFQSYLQTRFACRDREVVASAWAHAYTSKKIAFLRLCCWLLLRLDCAQGWRYTKEIDHEQTKDSERP